MPFFRPGLGAGPQHVSHIQICAEIPNPRALVSVEMGRIWAVSWRFLVCSWAFWLFLCRARAVFTILNDPVGDTRKRFHFVRLRWSRGVGCMEIGRILFSVGTNNGEIELSVCWIGFSCVVFQFASVFGVC